MNGQGPSGFGVWRYLGCCLGGAASQPSLRIVFVWMLAQGADKPFIIGDSLTRVLATETLVQAPNRIRAQVFRLRAKGSLCYRVSSSVFHKGARRDKHANV